MDRARFVTEILNVIDALPGPLEDLRIPWSPLNAELLLAKAQATASDVASARATAEAMDGAAGESRH